MTHLYKTVGGQPEVIRRAKQVLSLLHIAHNSHQYNRALERQLVESAQIAIPQSHEMSQDGAMSNSSHIRQLCQNTHRVAMLLQRLYERLEVRRLVAQRRVDRRDAAESAEVPRPHLHAGPVAVPAPRGMQCRYMRTSHECQKLRDFAVPDVRVLLRPNTQPHQLRTVGSLAYDPRC